MWPLTACAPASGSWKRPVGNNGFLGTKKAAELLGAQPATLSLHVRQGYLRARGRCRRGGAYELELSDVVDYWRAHRQGACARCSILGEATPERGFLCVACEYEVQTGRIWWPALPRRTVSRLPQGRLLIALGGDGDPLEL